MSKARHIEYTIAVTSFIVAVVFAFVSLSIAEAHEIAAGNCTIIAQFLLLTASIFGIDYKLGTYGSSKPQSNNPGHTHAQDN